MHLRSTKKLAAEVYLEEPIGKDKEDNVVTLQEVLENQEKSVEDVVDLKFKVKKLYEKIQEILKGREKTIIELRFGLDGNKPKTQNQIAEMLGISRSYVSRIETKAIGITAENLKEIKENPYLAGIDVSSGVETEGVKDGAKIKLFVKEVRRLQAEWEKEHCAAVE